MGLFVAEDPHFDPDARQTGFLRYRQLLSRRAGAWLKVNLLTLAGALPLAVGLGYALLSSSVLVLLPAGLIGGAVFGPFLAALYDSVYRGLRDAPGKWWDDWKNSWRKNARDSLLPGALLGLMTGVYAFMAALFWWAETPQTPGTVALYVFSGGVFVTLNTLYWPQLVLFRQRTLDRLRNILLFAAKYFWRVAGTALMQMAYALVLVLFAPWTLALLPLTGLWYIVFLAQFFLYTPLDRELHIEERFRGQ